MIINASTTKASGRNHDDENDDIVTINAGGKLFQVLRSTLCLPPDDTAFTKLFRKKTNKDTNTFQATHNILPSRSDADGNLFLDHDPQLVETILNFLRAKKIEDPFDPIVEPPFVPPHKVRDFRRILNHFGLTAFFYYPSTMPAAPAIATAIPNIQQPINTSMTHWVHHVRKMSLDSHDLSDSSRLHQPSSHDSVSLRTEDNSIVEEFDYCYG